MIQTLEKKLDQDELVEHLINLKAQTLKRETCLLEFENEVSPVIPYLHWGTNLIVTYDPLSKKANAREISRIIPDFSRSIVADENRVFCVGG